MWGDIYMAYKYSFTGRGYMGSTGASGQAAGDFGYFEQLHDIPVDLATNPHASLQQEISAFIQTVDSHNMIVQSITVTLQQVPDPIT